MHFPFEIIQLVQLIPVRFCIITNLYSADHALCRDHYFTTYCEYIDEGRFPKSKRYQPRRFKETPSGQQKLLPKRFACSLPTRCGDSRPVLPKHNFASSSKACEHLQQSIYPICTSSWRRIWPAFIQDRGGDVIRWGSYSVVVVLLKSTSQSQISQLLWSTIDVLTPWNPQVINWHRLEIVVLYASPAFDRTWTPTPNGKWFCPTVCWPS